MSLNWWRMEHNSPQNKPKELRALVSEWSEDQREAVLALVRRYNRLQAVDPELTFDQYLDRLEFLVSHPPAILPLPQAKVEAR